MAENATLRPSQWFEAIDWAALKRNGCGGTRAFSLLGASYGWLASELAGRPADLARVRAAMDAIEEQHQALCDAEDPDPNRIIVEAAEDMAREWAALVAGRQQGEGGDL